MSRKIILATTSPFRIDAFNMLGIKFECMGSEVNENFDDRPTDPGRLVLCLAKLKAEAVAGYIMNLNSEIFAEHKKGLVIGFDSVGYFEKTILEKPASYSEAFERLKAMSRKRYQFYTGICMISLPDRKIYERLVITDLVMRNISEKEIEFYLNQDPNYNKYAQGFDPLGNYSSTFIKEIRGSYNNPLRGIPLEVIVEMINQIDPII
jgi:septum formation protein